MTPAQRDEQTPTAGTSRSRTWPAVLSLTLLAGLIPESIATSNTPVLAYAAAPATLAFLAAFYGGAAVAIREARLRLRLGWTDVMLLATAFGFANEGVIAATWYRVAPTGYTYTPGHPGVDVAWALFLTVFHVVFSIVIPILLVEAMFPDIARRPWVRRRGLAVSSALPLLLTLATLAAPTYRPQRLSVIAAILVLVAIALRPRTTPASTPRTPVPAGRPVGVAGLRITGAALTVALFTTAFLVPGVCGYAVPHRLAACQPLYIALILTVAAVGTATVRRWSRHPAWGLRHNLALITGLLIPAMIIVTANPRAFAAGALVLSGPFAVLLIRLARRYRTTAPGTASQ